MTRASWLPRARVACACPGGDGSPWTISGATPESSRNVYVEDPLVANAWVVWATNRIDPSPDS